MGPPEQGSDWNDTGIDGVYRFLSKVWAIAMKNIENPPVPKPDVIKETHKLIKGLVERLKNQKVNTAISLFMSYINYIAKDHPEGIDKDASEDEIIQKAKSSDTIKGYMEGSKIYKEIYIPQKIINFVVNK